MNDLDNKRGVDIFVDKNNDLVFNVYGSFYTKDEKHYMNITQVKVEGLEQEKKVNLGDLFEEKTVNNKKNMEVDR